MAAELEPYTVRLPEHGGDGAPSFLRLAGKMSTLTAAALALKEGLWLLKRHMEHDADDADHMAEQSTAAEVEPRFTGLIHTAAGELRAVADASADVADSADQMEVNARGFTDAHESEYRGVYEAVRASGVQQAKAGFYRTR
jgi:uncharacterized membrane protein YkoI